MGLQFFPVDVWRKKIEVLHTPRPTTSTTTSTAPTNKMQHNRKASEETYVFLVNASVFLTDYAGPVDSAAASAYVKEHNVADALAAEIADPFTTLLNTSLQHTSYNADTGIMTALFNVVIGPTTAEFARSTDYAQTFKDIILNMSFEEGIYESCMATYTVDGNHIGRFDVRDPESLRVELVAIKPGPSQQDYENLWAKRYEQDRSKMGPTEVIQDWHIYSAVEGKERHEVMHNLWTKYTLRGAYNVLGIYTELFNRHFYATNDDRLNALHRVIR